MEWGGVERSGVAGSSGLEAVSNGILLTPKYFSFVLSAFNENMFNKTEGANINVNVGV